MVDFIETYKIAEELDNVFTERCGPWHYIYNRGHCFGTKDQPSKMEINYFSSERVMKASLFTYKIELK